VLAVVLGAAIVASVLGTICSVTPSMALRSSNGTIAYEYGLSVVIAPALFTAIIVVAARALRPSRKRLLVAGSTILGAFPIVLGIRLVREPLLDLDDEVVKLAPWALHTFVACTAVLLAAAILLLVYADALGTARGPDLTAAHARIAKLRT
jgi:hypothetical protein